MHGDFSRDSHDPKKNFTRVLMQQGRLLVDADWNEQSAIMLNYLRTLAADIIGWHGGSGVEPGNGKSYSTTTPTDNLGPFLVNLNANKELEYVSGGRYYVDGLLITERDAPFDQELVGHIQVDNKPNTDDFPNQLIFIDAYEQHVIAESDSSIRDDALGGLETTSRSRLATRIRLLHTDLDENSEELKRPESDLVNLGFRDIVIKNLKVDTKPVLDSRRLHETKLPHLMAWTNLNTSDQEDCVEEDITGYTGLENQLYRVEVHHAGADGATFWDGSELDSKIKDPRGAFTLKWSRDNGSIVYAATAGTTTATLKTKSRDESRAIRKGDYVELIPSSSESGTIVSVTDVQDDNGVITIEFAPPGGIFQPEEKILVRRWDHRNRKSFPISANGGFLVKESEETGDSVVIPLEDGVVVQLSLGKDGDVRKLQAGDYWLIPARAVTGDVIWPRDDSSKPQAVPASYIEHHYAPIALIKAGNTIIDLRRKIDGIAK